MQSWQRRGRCWWVQLCASAKAKAEFLPNEALAGAFAASAIRRVLGAASQLPRLPLPAGARAAASPGGPLARDAAQRHDANAGVPVGDGGAWAAAGVRGAHNVDQLDRGLSVYAVIKLSNQVDLHFCCTGLCQLWGMPGVLCDAAIQRVADEAS